MDYDVIYKGIVIGNIQASSDAEAKRNAQAMYGSKVTVERS